MKNRRQPYNKAVENLCCIVEQYCSIMSCPETTEIFIEEKELKKDIQEWKNQNDIPFTLMFEMFWDWAQDFEDEYVNEDWENKDYLETIDKYVTKRLSELGKEEEVSEYKIGDIRQKTQPAPEVTKAERINLCLK